MGFITQIYFKVWEFWKRDKYCDVTIEVQGEVFKCHRLLLAAASKYFDIMFSGNVLEGRTNNVVLEERDISALTFKHVLYYIYTGLGIIVTKDNVFNILRASRFFQIVSLEEECIGFIQNNNLPVNNTLGVFKYARQIDNKLLIAYTSQYIMGHFNEFNNDGGLLELSLEDLYTLFDNRLYLSVEGERAFIYAILRWVNHTRKTHTREFEEITKKSLPEESAKSDLLKLIQEINRQRPASHGSAGSSDYTDPPLYNISIKPKWDLHLYFTVSMHDQKMKVYSLDRKMSRGKVSCSVRFFGGMFSAVGAGDYLYCLSKKFKSDIKPDKRDESVVFQACPSVDCTFESPANRRLKSPPTSVDEYYPVMCNIQNKIYLDEASQSLGTEPPLHLQPTKRDYYEGIYVYNIDIDKWSLGPAPKVHTPCSTIVAYNNVLYLVECRGVVHALDDRTSEWHKLNTAGTCTCIGGSLTRMRTCVQDGKIHVVTGGNNFGEACRYDLTASKWEKMASMSVIVTPIKLLSYENLVWGLGFCPSGTIVETYNALLDKWSPLSLRAARPFSDVCFQYAALLEGVVFKPV